MTDDTPRSGQPPRINVRDKRQSADPEGSSPAKRPPSDADRIEPEPLERDIAEISSRMKELEDLLLRERADYANYKKRLVREQTDLVERASLRVVERLLPVLDDFERALGAVREHIENDAYLRGLEIVRNQLQSVLEEEGLERVVAEGAFDPHEHEAVSSVTGDVSEPTVLEVVRPGYKLKGKTIRPALVHVSVPKRSQREDGE